VLRVVVVLCCSLQLSQVVLSGCCKPTSSCHCRGSLLLQGPHCPWYPLLL
jgi:hypothetical protein